MTKDSRNLLSETEDVWYNNKCQQENEYEAFWQNLTITDDFIFGKIMLDKGL